MGRPAPKPGPVSALARSWAVPLTAWSSLGLGLFWTAGIVLDSTLGWNRPWLLVTASAAVASLPTVLPRLRRRGHLALSPKASWWRMGMTFLILCPVCWLCLTLPSWVLARMLVKTWPDPSHPDAGLFISILTFWLPQWWAPGVASLLVWRRHRAHGGS